MNDVTTTSSDNSTSETSPEPSRCGLVQVFTGDGKGKTTAALGTALRALGHGLRVFVAVFMKGNYPYGEWQSLARFPNATVQRFGFLEFTDPNNIKPEEKEQAELALSVARKAMLSGQYDLVILDEVNVASAWHLIEMDDLVRLVKEKPANVELILTGRLADRRLTDLADLVTECVKIKHPYDKGVLARQGIEF